MYDQLRIAPPPTTAQQRIAPPTPTYYVWAMDGKGQSRRLFGPTSSPSPTLAHAQRLAALAFKDCPNHFVYVVGWRGYICIGHWHNLCGPSADESNWQRGDIRNQVRTFIKH